VRIHKPGVRLVWNLVQRHSNEGDRLAIPRIRDVEISVIALDDCRVGVFSGSVFQRIENLKVFAVHMKAVDQTEAGFVKVAACGNSQSRDVTERASSEYSVNHQLLVNMRAVGSAQSVREIVEASILQFTGNQSGFKIACFHPSPPKPERRASHLWRSGIEMT
jgi:hypothetical protein